MNRKARRLEAKANKRRTSMKEFARAGMGAVVVAGMLGSTFSTPAFANGGDCVINLDASGGDSGTDFQFLDIYIAIQSKLDDTACLVIKFSGGAAFYNQDFAVDLDSDVVEEGTLTFRLDNTDTDLGPGTTTIGELPAFVINRDVTIDGSLGMIADGGETKARYLRIDAEGVDRIFDIVQDNPSDPAPVVTIRNMDLVGGSAASGGAINSTGDLDIYNVYFIDNDAYDGTGGAVSTLGSVTVDTSLFEFNHAYGLSGAGFDSYDGGAIYSEQDVSINNSDFYDNSASFGDGGAVYAVGNVSVSGQSNLDGNDAYDGSGGAIYSEGDVSVERSDFYDNNTKPAGFSPMGLGDPSSEFNGGAIYSVGSFVSSSSYFNSNDAYEGSGGAIYAENDVALVDNVFFFNDAYVSGGAIFAEGPLADVRSDFYDNDSNTGSGGAIYSASNFSPGDLSRISDVTVQSIEDSVRGPIVLTTDINWDANVVLKNSQFGENESFNDHGGALAAEGSTIIRDSFFDDNNASEDGGAIYVDDSAAYLDVSKSYFYDNDSYEDDGGAIYSRAAITVSESHFEENDSDEDGGAIYGEDSSRIVFTTFDDNNARNDNGGAIYAGDKAEIADSEFIENDAESGDGGAIAFEGDLDVVRSTFTDNEAEDGAALFYYDAGETGADVSIRDSEFISNEAEDDGGALRIRGGNAGVLNLEIDNSTFVKNFADRVSGSGGAIDIDRDNVVAVIENSDFIGNDAYDGGAIAVHSDLQSRDSLFMDGNSKTTVNASTFSGNTATTGSAIRSGGLIGDGLVVTNSTFVMNAGKSIRGVDFPGAPLYLLGYGTIAVANGLVASSTFVNNFTHADVWAADIYDEDGGVGVASLPNEPSNFDEDDYAAFMSSRTSVAVFGNIFAMQEDAFPNFGSNEKPWSYSLGLLQDPRVSWGDPTASYLNTGFDDFIDYANQNGYEFDRGPIIDLGGNLSTSNYVELDFYNNLAPLDTISTEFFLSRVGDATLTSFEDLEFTNLEPVLREARKALIPDRGAEESISLEAIDVLRISEESSAVGNADRDEIGTDEEEYSNYADFLSETDGLGRTRLDPFDSGAFQVNIGEEEEEEEEEEVARPRVGGGGGGIVLNVPTIASISQARIVTSGGRLTIVGTGFLGATGVSIGGKAAPMVSVSDSQIVVDVPAGSVGFVTIVVTTPGGAASLNNGLEYFAAPAAARFTASAVASGFAPNSATLTPSIKRTLRALLAENPNATIIRCVGFTSSPVLAGDQALAKLRAQRACNFMLRLKPTLEVVSVRGIKTSDAGSSVRRVRVLLG